MIPRDLLKEVLLEQRMRITQFKDNEYVTRDRLGDIRDTIGLKHSIVVTGIRQCGKSVLLMQTIRANFKDFYYVSFEDERLAGFKLGDFAELYEVFLELFGESKFFFLDEVQNIPGWERWVRRMYDDSFKFYITGSNATLMSKELGTLLTGRHLQLSLFPLSYIEFLRFNGIEYKKEDAYLTKRRALLKKHLTGYISKGGFPEYLKHERVEILQGYFNDIIQKDVVERYHVKHIVQLKELARYLLVNTGCLSSYNRLKTLTESISVNTVIKYTSYLENAFLIFRVPYYSRSLRKQSANPFKTYAIDTGLRNAISFQFTGDIGRLYETLVAIELKRQGWKMYYWRNRYGEEVDFVVGLDKGMKQLIQVCYNLDDAQTKKREVHPLVKAGNELNIRNLLVITGEYESTEKHGGKTISFVPLWKWLLGIHYERQVQSNASGTQIAI